MPRAIQLAKQIKRACQNVRDGQINASQHYLLGVVDTALNELIRQDDPAFYLKHIESGSALLDRALRMLSDSGLSLPAIPAPAYEVFHDGFRHEVLDAEISRIEQGLVAALQSLDACAGIDSSNLAVAMCGWSADLWLHRSQPTPPVDAPPVITRAGLETYLREKFPAIENLTITKFSALDGGFSKQTILFETSEPIEGQRALVVRAEQPVSLLAGWDGSDITREVNSIRLVRRAGLPVPEVLWLEDDPGRLGNRFIVSCMAPGRGLGSSLGGNEKIDDEAIESVFDLLLKTHGVDIRRERELAATSHLARWLDFETVEQCTRYMVNDYMEEMLEKSDVPTTPMMVRGMKWLRENVPGCGEAPVLLHQDFALNNMLFDGNRVSALLDWETSRLGDPADDLHYTQQNLADYLSMPELLARYNAATGRNVDGFRLAYARVIRCMLNVITFQRSLATLDRDLDTNINLCILGFEYAGIFSGPFNELIDAAEAERRS